MDEKKIIEIRIVGIEEGARELAVLNERLEQQKKLLSELKSAKEKDGVAIAQQTLEIAKTKTAIRELTNEVANEIKIRQKRAEQIDAQVAKELAQQQKAEQQAAKMAMTVENENRRRQAMIEKQSQAETIAAQKAEQQAAKKVGYINELKIKVSELEQSYYRLTKAQLEDVNVGGKMLTELKEKRAELSKLQQAYGNYNLNVGNYSSATKMLGINIGQVLKEMPNFAISARIGIMSLTNNLPMLAETIKQVRVEQLAMIEAGKKAPSMFSLISKSIFGLTGIMSIAMVLLQLYSEDISKWVSGLFTANKASDKFNESQKAIIKTLTEQNGITKTNTAKIYELGVAIDKYKEGTGSANKIIEDYNSTLGVHYGKLNDINDVMAAYPKYAEDYINWSIKMAAAMLQVDEAAKLQLNIQKVNETLVASYSAENIKKVEDYNSALKKIYQDNWSGKSDAITTKNRILSLQQTLGEIANYTEINKLLGERADNQNKLNKILKSAKELYPGDFSSGDAKEIKNKTLKESKEIFDFEKALRDAQSAAIQNSAIRELQEVENKYKDKQDKLDEALKKNLVSQEQFNTLSLEYSNALYREQNDILNKYNKKWDETMDKLVLSSKKAFEDILNEQIKLTDGEVKIINDYLNALDNLRKESQELLFADSISKDKAQLETKYQTAISLANKLKIDTLAIEEEYSAASNEIKRRQYLNQLDMGQQLANGLVELLGKESEAGKFASAAAVSVEGVKGAYSAGVTASLYFAEQRYVEGALAVAQGVLIAANTVKAIADIYAVNTDVKSNTKTTTSTVTEKFHTGKDAYSTTANNQLKSDEIYATLLKTETVLDPRSSSVFNSILGRIQSFGGSEQITNGIGVNDYLQEQMLVRAFSVALKNQKPQQISWSEFSNQAQRQQQLENNLFVR